ncbi:MAG TPA: hypothetical protein VHC41_01800 [Mycobacteriales bacterium]|nr:hypothetical protein [Mycobacteriales bacterium]
MDERLEVVPDALVATAMTLRPVPGQLVDLATTLAGVAALAGFELGALQTAEALQAFAAGWQPVLVELARRGASLVGLLASAGGDYSAIDQGLFAVAGQR